MRCCSVALFALSTLTAPSAFAQLTIGIAGSGLGCQYSNLSAAVAAASAGDTLYLVAGSSYFDAVVINKDLDLVAGNSGCNGSAAAGAAHAVITGLSLLRPLEITGGAAVELNRVDVARGVATEGGNIRVTSGELRAVDSSIYLGVADAGGGIYIAAGSSAELLGSTAVSWNVAEGCGGGIYTEGELELVDQVVIGDALFGNFANGGGGVCVKEGGDVTMFDDAAIVGNDATSGGGGVDLYSDATFLMLSGRIGGPLGEANTAIAGGGVRLSGELTMLGGEIAYNEGEGGGGVAVIIDGNLSVLGWASIHHNTATNDGGGILLHWANHAVIQGEISDNTAGLNGGGIALINHDLDFELQGANILRNHAGGDGGGLWLEGPMRTIAIGTWINDNSADGVGGGISFDCYDVTGNELELSGPVDLQEGCEYRGPVPADVYCSEIRGNTASEGGGIYAHGGLATIEETAFIGNEATVQGSALLAGASEVGFTPTDVELKNVLIVRQKGAALDVVRVEDAATLRASHVTMARNEGTPVHVVSTALGYLRRSIVWDNGDVVIDPPLVFSAACTSFNGVSGQTSGVNRDFFWDPQFVVTPRGHFRLDAVTSTNSVDQCAAGAAHDLDDDPRPAGPQLLWDRGAFEAQ